jgi:hypothetical protein
MRHHPAWLAVGLLVFVVLACNLGKKNANNANLNGNANTNAGSTSSGGGETTGPGIEIAEIHMAKDDGNGDPGDETSIFERGDRTIHCVTTLKAAKSGTQMKFSWWIVDAGDTQNRKIKEINYRTRTLENIVHGHLTLPQDWPAGKYKVDVYVNGDLDKTVFYTVQ